MTREPKPTRPARQSRRRPTASFRLRRRTLPISTAFALTLVGALAACSTPTVEGPTSFVVGQRVTVELEQGPEFLEGEFTLTDSSGYAYGPDDPLLDYSFGEGTAVQFTVPYGIASGPATLSIGAKGRDPYTFEVEIVRLLLVLGQDGALTVRSADDPAAERARTAVGTGPGSLHLSGSGSQLLAVSEGTGQMYFLELHADELVPFAPSIDLGFPVRRGVLTDSGALVAADRGLASVARLPDGSLVLDDWLETGPAAAVATAAETGRAVVVGTTEDASPFDYLQRLNLATRPPDLTPPVIRLGGTAGGVVDVAMDPTGELGIAANALDDTLATINLASPSASPTIRPLPDGNSGPSRLVMARRGNYLAVVCPGSGTVAVYAVEGGGIAPVATVVADPRTADPAAASPPVDAAFAPPKTLVVLLEDGSLVHADLGADPPEPSVLLAGAAAGGAALVLQP